MANLKDDSTVQNTIISSFNLLDTSIQEGSTNLNLLSSRFDRVMSLKREVELKENDAEEAKEAAAKGGLDILAEVEELKEAQQGIKEINDMHARKVYAQKVVLAKELKELQIRMSGVSNEGRTSLGVLDQMHRALKMRLTEAFKEDNLADEEKLRKEILAQQALALEESQKLKLVEESEKLKEEEVKNSKLRDLFKQRQSTVNIIHGDVSAIHQDINVFIERFVQPAPQLGGSSQTSSSLPFSSSSLTSSLVNKVFHPSSEIEASPSITPSEVSPQLTAPPTPASQVDAALQQNRNSQTSNSARPIGDKSEHAAGSSAKKSLPKRKKISLPK